MLGDAHHREFRWLVDDRCRRRLSRHAARGKLRGEESVGVRVPDPIVSHEDQMNPEHEILLAESVGLALLAILETLPPPERLAFVLHDTLDLPFEDIAPIVGRSAIAARQLASRGRRRVRGACA
jgi:DNA-directed RNA polymerase specialized sigma24 family protein